MAKKIGVTRSNGKACYSKFEAQLIRNSAIAKCARKFPVNGDSRIGCFHGVDAMFGGLKAAAPSETLRGRRKR